MNSVLITARVALAGIFLLAAITKLLDVQGSRSALEGFGVRGRWVAPAAVALPLAELSVAILVIPAATARGGAALAIVLLSTFEVGIVLALRRGTTPQCHCFGQLHSRPAGTETLARNAAFLAVALCVLVAGPGPELGSWAASTSGQVIALAATSLVVAAMAYVCLYLWQENRRLEGRAGRPREQPPDLVGRPAPRFALRDLDGASIDSEQLFAEGQGAVLVFTSATCGPCLQLLPELAQWRQMLAGRLRIEVLAAGDEAENRRLGSEHDLPVLLDPDRAVADAYQISATPSAIEIDPDGTVGGSPVAGTPAIEGLIRAILKPAKLSVHDQRRVLRGEGDVYLSARDRERLVYAIHKPVRDVDRPPPSRWERSRQYQTLRQRVTQLLFERQMSTEGEAIELEHFDPELVPYEPTSWLPLRWSLRRIRPGRDDVLVDFGCGKGRVVCEAARRPFARVVGVEISQHLLEAAQVNVQRNRRGFKCQDIELVKADAAAWEIPDDMTVAYLYHPFAGAVFHRVIENIVQSIRRNPRRVRLVYVGPVLADEVASTGYFRLVGRRQGHGRRTKAFNSVALFEHDPVRDGTPVLPARKAAEDDGPRKSPAESASARS